MIRCRSVFAGLGALALMFAGCVTPGSEEPAAEVAPSSDDGFVDQYLALETDLSREEVVERLGEPDRIEPYVVEGIESEIWHYNRIVDIFTRSVTKDTTEEAYWDLAANRLAVRQVGVEGTERTEVRVEAQLLFYDGRLTSWKDQIQREHTDY